MKLLVTGGAGFIGSNFIRYWLDKYPNDQITNLDKLTYAGHLSSTKDFADNPNYQFIKGDICNPKVVNEAMKDTDVVVNFAAESHVDRSIVGPKVFLRTNVIGTQILLDAALKAKIKKFHHVSCYDSKTRAFTRDGIKGYKEVKRGDLVLSINPLNGILEWKPVKKVIIQDYKGEMISMKSKTVDLLVTPNHRMLYQAKKSKKFEFKEAVLSKKEAINKLPKYYRWDGKIAKIIMQFGSRKEDFMYLLGIFIGDGVTAYQEKISPNKTGLNKAEYIASVRDRSGRFSFVGKIGKRSLSKSMSWRIFLDIPVRDKARKKCEEVLTNLGIKWHAQKGASGEHLYFTSKKFVKIFNTVGKGALNKNIPRWALEAPNNLLEPLFDGLMDSDGCKRCVFYTSSKNLGSSFVELCTKLGYSTSLSLRHSRSYIGERKIEGDSYMISIGREWRSIRREIVKEENYDGKIWCLKVEDNKNFLVERNGKFVFSGNTDEVFGALNLDSKEKFKEDTPYNPRSPYSASKAASDYLVRSYYHTYGFPITITNCSNNYGPYQDPEKFFSRSITNLIEGKEIFIYGDGKYVRDWLYVEDHCSAIDLIIGKGKPGETYLVGGLSEDISNEEIAKLMVSHFGKDESYLKYGKDRLGHDRRYAVDWSKINKELGWEPKHDFQSWLTKTIEWYKENEWWWKPLKKEAEKLYKKTGQI